MLSIKTFVDSIRFASHAAATKDVRFYLNGVALDFSRDIDKEEKPCLYAVATDGSRIARISMPLAAYDLPNITKKVREANPIIIDNESVAALLAIKKPSDTQPVNLKLIPKEGGDDAYLIVEAGAHTISCKLIDGTFPDYRRIFPKRDEWEKGSAESADVGMDMVFLSEGAEAIAKLHKAYGRRYKAAILSVHADNIVLYASTGSMGEGGPQDPIVKIMAMRR